MDQIATFCKRQIAAIMLINSLCIGLFANINSEICINNFELKISDSIPYQNIHKALYKRLLHENLPNGFKPVLSEEKSGTSCNIEISGKIEIQDNIPTFKLHISGPTSVDIDSKNIQLKGLEIEQLLDVIILKIRYFLEHNTSGILRLSSTPLGCSILLNGITIGTTPAELTLEKGSYILKFQREHFRPFIDTVDIKSGKETSVQAAMRFEGYNQKPWLMSASFLTICTTISWIIEGSLHKKYTDIPKGSPEWYSDKPYKRYRNANYIRIGLLNASALCWTVNGFIMVRNNALKKNIFGK